MTWDTATLDNYLDQMANTMTDYASQANFQLVGIHTGGVWVAEALSQRLPGKPPVSTLTANFYRDDLKQRGMKLDQQPSDLPISVENSHILLVDDVLMSGRTIRAAINELFDHGRPASIRLAVLFDIGQRELPMCADFCGKTVALSAQERVELRGPAPLRAECVTFGETA